MRALLAPLILLATLGAAAGAWSREAALEETSKLKSLLTAQRDGRDRNEPLRAYFSAWAEQHGRNYSGDEYDTRLAQFRKGVQAIIDVNERLSKDDSGATFWAAPGPVTDMNFQEFKAAYLGTRVPEGLEPRRAAIVQGAAATGRRLRQFPKLAPMRVNWVEQGKVTPVREQGECSACWAFAAAAALESRYLISSGKKLDLSEQQLVDCVPNTLGIQGTAGCSTGWPTDALKYVARRNLTTEDKYPFSGASGSCDRSLLSATTKSDIARLKWRKAYRTVHAYSAQELMQAVSKQPIITAFAVDESFIHYAGGVYRASWCTDANINHSLLTVGYSVGSGIGSDDSWWLMKNSWGTDWGEEGFARVQMAADGFPGACSMYTFNFIPAPVIGPR